MGLGGRVARIIRMGNNAAGHMIYQEPGVACFRADIGTCQVGAPRARDR